MAVMVGVLSGAVIFNALKPHKKTADYYVNCFNREVEMYKLPDNIKEMANSYIEEYLINFNLKRISEREAEEFMQKTGYGFEKYQEFSGNDSLVYKVRDISTYEKAMALSDSLFKCLRDSRRNLLINSTSYSHGKIK